MSIKYSAILAANEVFVAGDNDIIIIAIVDGGSPTGYTTKAILKKNLISGGGGNTLYSADDVLAGERVVTMGAFGLSFEGNQTTFKGIDDTNGTTVFRAENNSGSKFFYMKGNGDVLMNAGFNNSSNDIYAGRLFSGGLTGSSGGYTFATKSSLAGSAGLSRFLANTGSSQFDLRTNGSNIVMGSFTDGAGVSQSLIHGDGNSYFKKNVAIGHDTPTTLLHVKLGDIKFEGLTDPNLVTTAHLTNQWAIGSNPYANVKASITNTEGVTHSFLVLNQATTAEFGVLETGVVYMNNQLSVGAGQVPSSSSRVIVSGDIEIGAGDFRYDGDPTTNGTWRRYNDGLNLVTERREAGIWVLKNTIFA